MVLVVPSRRATVTGEVEAVKVFRKTEHGTPQAVLGICKEADFLRRFEHEHVITLKGMMNSPHHVLLRMEYAGARNLHKALMSNPGHRWSLARARNLFGQLAGAVAHCHGRGVAHCDLKPENVVVSSCGERLKVIDFGCAEPSGGLLHSPRGTMPFISPEAMTADRSSGYDAAGADVWAMGVVLLEMVLGVGSLSRILQWPSTVHPSARCRDELVSLFSHPEVIHQAVERVAGVLPPNLAELLHRVFCIPPASRLRAQQVEGHAWLQQTPPQHRAEGLGRAMSGSKVPAAPVLERPENLLPRRPSGHRPRSAQRPGPRPWAHPSPKDCDAA